MKVQIKHRITDAVLFECEAPYDIGSGLQMRHAVEKAITAGADLCGADLRDANLRYAYLRGTNLCGADLRGTNLCGADLRGTNLCGADLRDANLSYADLRDADLSYADLRDADLSGAYLSDGAKLIGDRPVFQVGPILSRCATFTAYMTDKGLLFAARCQRQITREKFEERLANEHGDNKHAKKYRAALALIDAHAEIWKQKGDKNA